MAAIRGGKKNTPPPFVLDEGTLFTSSFDVEFDDSLLGFQGYTNPRFDGCKLTSAQLNVFTPGDITYGKNPVVTSKITAIFVGSTLTDGLENTTLAQIDNHSYATIDKILLIDTQTDEVTILEEQNVGEAAFKRMVVENFHEGKELQFKLLNPEIDHLLKKRHFVKFNEGALMRIYTYTPDTSETGTNDGVFGGIGNKFHADANVTFTSSSVAGFTNNLGETGGPNPDSDLVAPNLGGGLFGFGQSIASSQSLFNTNSIDFVTSFPEELEEYNGEIDLEIAGSVLTVITGSYIVTGFGGGVALPSSK